MKLRIYLAMLLIGGASYCFAQRATATEPSKDAFVAQFMDANTVNDVATLEKLLANNAKITIPGKSQAITLSKKEYLQLMKQMGRDQQSCSPSYKMLNSSLTELTAEVYFIYTTYAVQNTITAEIKSGTWKVTGLVKGFISTEPVIVINTTH